MDQDDVVIIDSFPPMTYESHDPVDPQQRPDWVPQHPNRPIIVERTSTTKFKPGSSVNMHAPTMRQDDFDANERPMGSDNSAWGTNLDRDWTQPRYGGFPSMASELPFRSKNSQGDEDCDPLACPPVSLADYLT